MIYPHIDLWLVVGSQHLYGPKTLQQVAAHAEQIAAGLNAAGTLPARVVLKPTVTDSDGILALCREANNDPRCAGLLTWMHTFSPARMWIAGLAALQKPFMQLHTQFNVEVPWATMDMNFMNLNQTAHGGREYGHIAARLRRAHAVVAGHWQDARVQQRLDAWARVAAAVHDSRQLKVARFGDNMREVAVTEGDKVEAQMRFGYAVNGWSLGELAAAVDGVADTAVNALLDEYEGTYTLTEAVRAGGARRAQLHDAARIELGLKGFLDAGGFGAFTTTFENLHGLAQLPGLAVQRLMQQGYGFGAEGDWKTAALLRAAKVMGAGRPGGASFMEDYTYDLTPGQELVIGAHMLEVCPSIAAEARPVLDVQPLSIGKKDDPARLLFSARPGAAVHSTLIDLGPRFRLISHELDVLAPPHDLPRLPTARAVYRPLPDLFTGTEAWIHAGGAHHTVFSQHIAIDQWRTLAEMFDIEFVHIGAHTQVPQLKQELRWNAATYG
ncbi:L-arabinose isomerase [Pseudaquabacterium pictum]|uniref:L-arabinose isomerase n=1 Tax=Pseudaquabacterium pictum TaxID=2315236 RepID=A0A480AW14_9BURK|nr:L-arabinose isomerase [Rubrivivax pictus]GCL63985.1 L-arabinose isomerase [Rubrivivax pictus]